MEKLIVSTVVYAATFALINFLLGAGFNLAEIAVFTGSYVAARLISDQICK